MPKQSRETPQRPPTMSEDLCVDLMNKVRQYLQNNPKEKVITAVRSVIYDHFYKQDAFRSGYSGNYLPWRTYLTWKFASNGGRVAAANRKATTESRPWSR